MMHKNCTAREERGSNLNASCLRLLVGRPRILKKMFEGGPTRILNRDRVEFLSENEIMLILIIICCSIV